LDIFTTTIWLGISVKKSPYLSKKYFENPASCRNLLALEKPVPKIRKTSSFTFIIH
jgi:hypothetical protein